MTAEPTPAPLSAEEIADAIHHMESTEPLDTEGIVDVLSRLLSERSANEARMRGALALLRLARDEHYNPRGSQRVSSSTMEAITGFLAGGPAHD